MSSLPLMDLTWSDRFIVGHPEIDRQHQVLFGIVDRAKAVVEHPGEGVDRAGVVGDLVKYVVQHFRFEEEAMAAAAYPARADHLAAHEAITRTVLLFRECHLGGQESVEAFADFLSSWVAHHIGDHDRRLAAFLNAAGR